MYFWSASELRNEFEVNASFYQTNLGNKIYRCRNHAIILRKGYTKEDVLDAVVIMANPGSCEPSDQSYHLPTVQDHFHLVSYVAVKDDPTQRQLMRLMKMMNWNYLSIINLSDLCSGNMTDFKQKLDLVKQFKNHSIFSDERVEERDSFLSGNKTRIILAWGKDPSIKQLALEALEKIPKKQAYGLRDSTSSYYFRHPNPMIKTKCMIWLKDMYSELNS